MSIAGESRRSSVLGLKERPRAGYGLSRKISRGEASRIFFDNMASRRSAVDIENGLDDAQICSRCPGYADEGLGCPWGNRNRRSPGPG